MRKPSARTTFPGIFKPRTLQVAQPLVTASATTVTAKKDQTHSDERREVEKLPNEAFSFDWSAVRDARQSTNIEPLSPLSSSSAAGLDDDSEKLLALILDGEKSMKRDWSTVYFVCDEKGSAIRTRIRVTSSKKEAYRADDRDLLKKVAKAFEAPVVTETIDIYPEVKPAEARPPKPAVPMDHNRGPKVTEPSIFELISGKKDLGEYSETAESHENAVETGGLFGFSDILPKISRLQDSRKRSRLAGGDYADILNSNEDVKDEDFEEKDYYDHEFEQEAEDEYLEEIMSASDGKNPAPSRHKLRHKEAKQAAAVEKILAKNFNTKL